MVLVLFLVTLITLFTFLALAIDLGMLAVARTQCQAAADAAAMAGTRTLNGISSNNNNYSNVSPQALLAAEGNSILGNAVQSSQVTVNIGRYAYNTTTQQFEGQIPGTSGTNWTLVQAQVTANLSGKLGFSKVFGFVPSNITTTSTGVHRPLDICVINDFTGSMRFASLLGTPYYGNRNSNNPDSVYPTWGAYSDTTDAAMQATSFTSPYDAANITTTTSDGRPPICADFYQDSSGTPAFTAASNTYATTPGGDVPLKTSKNTSSTWGQTLASILNISSPTNSTYDATFESSGYKAYSMASTFNRYTLGPGYYGKTFFIWPPDPSNGSDGTTNDWRKRYFTYPGTQHAHGRQFQAVGQQRQLAATGQFDLFNQLRGDPELDHQQPQSVSLDDAVGPDRLLHVDPHHDRHFDRSADRPQSAVLERLHRLLPGADRQLRRHLANRHERQHRHWRGYGDRLFLGHREDHRQEQPDQTGGKPFMHYGDNPQRPTLHFWFGPLTMVDFLGNYNIWYNVSPYCSRYCWWPGTCHESPLYACKLGIQAALTDIENNHPNNDVSLILFSTPRSSSGENDDTRFNRVRVGLSQNYSNMNDSLWYPPATVGNSSATVTPYDSNNIEVPRATGGTCYAYSLMLAYNQFSGNTSLVNYSVGQPAGDAGGNGRQGAQKIIIFETDGAPIRPPPLRSPTPARTTPTTTSATTIPVRRQANIPTGINGYSDNASTVTSQVYTLAANWRHRRRLLHPDIPRPRSRC